MEKINENYILTYCRKLCDKSICAKSRYKHFKSLKHKAFDESILRRYIVLNPNFDENDTIMRRYINKHNEEYDVRCVLKLLTTTNRVRYMT